MLKIGRKNTLEVSRESAHGLFLDAGDGTEILLPGKPPEGCGPGAKLDVFVYRDSEDRLVATEQSPKIMAGEFGLLRVVGVNRQIGAFLDWGLPKDLLLPFREQREPLREGDQVAVFVHVDAKSDRIVATTKWRKYLASVPEVYKEHRTVQALVAERTPLGYGAIVDGAYYGMLYHANLAGPLMIGQTVTAYVEAVREDGKLDLRLDAAGYQRVASLTDQILEALAKNDGTLALDDSSDPSEIREAFGVSKKAFKQALGALFKKRLIRFEPPGIVAMAKPGTDTRGKGKSRH